MEIATRFEFVTIDSVVAKRALGKMKNSFGCRSDSIRSYFINIAFPVILQLFYSVIIFNFSINTGMLFPESWKTARVAPIIKNGECDDRSNY